MEQMENIGNIMEELGPGPFPRRAWFYQVVNAMFLEYFCDESTVWVGFVLLLLNLMM